MAMTTIDMEIEALLDEAEKICDENDEALLNLTPAPQKRSRSLPVAVAVAVAAVVGFVAGALLF